MKNNGARNEIKSDYRVCLHLGIFERFENYFLDKKYTDRSVRFQRIKICFFISKSAIFTKFRPKCS